MNLDFNIHLDVTSYEADLIKEGLKSLLRRRYEEHKELGPEQNDYIVGRVKDIRGLYEKIERLQAEYPNRK